MKSTWSHSDALLLFPLPSSHPTEINLEPLGTVNIQVYELRVILTTAAKTQFATAKLKRYLEKNLPPKLAAIAVLFDSRASTPHESSYRLPADHSFESLTLTLVQRDFGDV